MQQTKRKFKFGMILTLVFSISLILSASGFAAVNSGVTVTGSNLSGGTITFGNYSAITLNGTEQTTTTTWPIGNIVDARGNGSGWNLSLTLSQLSEYDTSTSTYVSSGKTLDLGSIKVSTIPVVSMVDSTSSASSTITTVALNTSLDTGSPVKLIIAPALKGMGSYSMTALGTTLTVPASAYAATYKTNATVALSTGP